jgi:hypothetical protein
MAIAPMKLIETFNDPQLSPKDKALVAKIEKNIDDDIIRDYGTKYNYNNTGFMGDGFKCTIYTLRYLRDITFDSTVLVKAYLLNSYRKQGWNITLVGDNWRWDLKFDKAELRNTTIDSILDDIEKDEKE